MAPELGADTRWSCSTTLATVIASQALISGAFSLTRQAVQLGYLPRVRHRAHVVDADRPDLHPRTQLAAGDRVHRARRRVSFIEQPRRRVRHGGDDGRWRSRRSCSPWSHARAGAGDRRDGGARGRVFLVMDLGSSGGGRHEDPERRLVPARHRRRASSRS